MKTVTFDLEYLCGKMSDMSGLPIRIYENNKLTSRFFTLPFVADPADPYLDALLKRKEHVSYYLTGRQEYYGIIRHNETTIIIGPGLYTPVNNQQLHDMAFELNVTNRDFDSFADFIRAIVPIPLDSTIQMMCTINHILNGEKLNLSDFQLREIPAAEKIIFTRQTSSADAYKSYNIEKQILEIIKAGDTSVLEKWVRQAPTIKGGRLSENLLRQQKNTFIVTTTLAARSAIEAGVKVDTAFRLSDVFIQRCENCGHLNDLNYLQYEMILAYTKEVGNLNNLTTGSRISKDVYYYIQEHISDSIKTEDIAQSLYLSRSHLSTVFKEETGINLNTYIHQVKIEKAKELLNDATKSITLISDYLGYSSSSHFNRIFKSLTGISPKQYRKQTGHH